jgi:PAS domain S-box-containing protein
MQNESLKTALIEVDWLRDREARLGEDNAFLLRSLARVQQSTRPDSAIRSVLEGLCEEFACDLSALIEFDTTTQQARIVHSSQRELEGVSWRPGRPIFEKPRCFVSLDPERTGLQWPEGMLRLNAMVCVPTSGTGTHKSALACFSATPGAFSTAQLSLLERVAFFSAQSAETLRIARRNAALNAISRNSDPALRVSAPSELSDETPARLLNAQTIIMESLIDLVEAPVGSMDYAMQRALSQLGETLRLHEISLHEGTGAECLKPVIEWRSKDRAAAPLLCLGDFRLSDFLLAYPQLLGGEAVYIEDESVLALPSAKSAHIPQGSRRSILLVPVNERNAVTGVAIFRSARSGRNFAPAETYLLHAFSNLIASVSGRLRYEANLHATQASLEAERNRLNAILSAMPDLVVEIGPGGTVESFHSERFYALAGYPQQIIGADPKSLLSNDVYSVYRTMCEELRSYGIAGNREVQVHLREKPYWFLLSASTFVPSVAGARSSFIFVVRNITQERARREEIEQLSMIARRTSNLVILTDPVGKIVWVNDAFERRTGYRLDEVVGESPGKLLQGPQSDLVMSERMRAAKHAGVGVQTQLINYDRHGTPYWVEMDIQPTRNERGEITGFMSVQNDITHQKQKIADLEKSERQVRSDWSAAMNASRDGIAITQASGHYTYMNKAHRDMFMVGDDVNIGQLSWRHLYLPETLREIEMDVLPELLEAGSWQGELAGRRLDGLPVMQEVSLTLQGDGGILCITRDIGERLAAEVERARVREVLQRAQRQEAIGQLASGLAHDFNNLIASIAGSAVLIQDQLNPASAPHAARILTAAEHAAALMQRVVDQGRRREQIQRIDIHAVLNEVADLAKSSLPRSVQLSIRSQSEGVVFEADPTDVLQVVLNLVINARDAIPQTVEKPAIQIAGYLADPGQLPAQPETGFIDARRRYYVFEVADNGTGMTADVKQKIFEPYFTTKGERGTGIGLIIVASIVEANGGAISVTTRPGFGSCVRIFWPLREKPALSPSLQESSHRIAAPPLDLLAARLMVVEDNTSFLEVLTAIFENAGAKVGAFSAPVDALQVFQKNPDAWDLLITDFDMPEMNGAELAYHVKQLRPGLRAILVTALADWRNRLNQECNGDFVSVIPKSARPSEFVTQVAKCLKAGIV